MVSVATELRSEDMEERTALQRCRYMRSFLRLEQYKSVGGQGITGPHAKISSKTLRECYVLPAEGGCIEGVFSKLAELMRQLKAQNTKPPRTDFTCLARLRRNKVFVDVDCVACKSGQLVADRRHFSFTKSFDLVVGAVNDVFDQTVTDGVYMTTGGKTCGYHLFFNSLAYADDAGVGVTRAKLMDALDKSFKSAGLTRAAVDRACTQMPLPTASHSNSTRYAVPYALKYDAGWVKEKLSWLDMDADTLKCFSCLAFPTRYQIDLPDGTPPADIVDLTTDVGEDAVANRKRKRADDFSTVSGAKSPDTKRWRNEIVEEVPQRRQSENDNVSEFSADTTDVKSFVCPGAFPLPSRSDDAVSSVFTTRTEGAGAHSFVCPRPPPTRRSNGKCAESVISALTEDATNDTNHSFVCPGQPAPSTTPHSIVDRERRWERRSDGPSIVFTESLGRMPYDCEGDKNSPFADKQYKAALLCAEETEATVSKNRLALENPEEPHRRVYIVPGSSSKVLREYKLLVQLVNVNRSVSGGDVTTRRHWTDLLVSYFDQHLSNPIILEILRFVLSVAEVEAAFPRRELEECKRSLARLMEPYKKRPNRERDAPSVIDEEREARPHKARLVGALVRVCTHLFGMVTAVVSDLRRVQKAMEFRDLSLLNRTVVNIRGIRVTQQRAVHTYEATNDDDDLDCSASTRGGGGGDREENDDSRRATNYTLLASLIVHEHDNVSDMALYAFLYYYHHFPSIMIDRLLDEIHHEGLMITAVIKHYMMYDHRGKPLTLQEIFEGFNDSIISLSGPVNFILNRRKNQRAAKNPPKNSTKRTRTQSNNRDTNAMADNSSEDRFDDSDLLVGADNEKEDSGRGGVTREETDKLLHGTERKRRRLMCGDFDSSSEARPEYEWKDRHLWQAVINYYLRPVVMHEDRLVFANDGYNTFEDDAVESCVAHILTQRRTTKADVTTAFKDARTVWQMHHSSQFVYESDLTSDTVGCCFHINIALKMYEMFCGGCVTRMRRVHRNYLIDRSRFNMAIYDVVAECRTATVNLTSAIDRSYMNLLLRQPVVPPFLEDAETRRLFLSDEEMHRGSFCCLTVMDYRRALNLFERSNCQSKSELETCEYVENFLDDLYTNEVAVELPPDATAESKMRLLYVFYSLYLYEVVFAMRHTHARRENCYVSVERLSYELDIHELLILFFGEASMRTVEGLDGELERRIRHTAEGLDNTGGGSGGDGGSNTNDDLPSDNSVLDIRPVLATKIPDKTLRMKTLFGQFGFDVMQEAVPTTSRPSTSGFDTFPSGGERSPTNDEENEIVENTRWDDEEKFEHDFYADENWSDVVCERIRDTDVTGKTQKQTPTLSSGVSRDGVFLHETVRSIMRLELKRNVDHDRMGKLVNGECNRELFGVMKQLPVRLKLIAFILTTHTFKLKTKALAPDFVSETYGDSNEREDGDGPHPERIWRRATEAVLSDRRALLTHARWLAERRFKNSFFVGLDPKRVYDVLYGYMRDNKERFPAFRRYEENEDTRPAASYLCTAMMYLLVMSAYDQEHVDLYLRVFLAAEWPGQWAKTIFVWKSNSNAGKSYLFDSIVKRACANSTCINDPKGGKENAPEKAEYVKNFVLFANEFSQANSNELKKIVSESTFKFRMNYGNMMNEAYATGKIMFNCNTLPPTSDEAAINRLTLFNIPFWFGRRQKISDAMLNWICGLSDSSKSPSARVMAYRYELPSLLTEAERRFLESHNETKNETDLFNGYVAVRPGLYAMESNKALSPLFLVQNKISLVYALSSPPTEHIVHGLVNITNHFSWLRFFKRLDMPVDFSSLPASSEAVRSEWLNLTLPYQEWKQLTGAKIDLSSRVPAECVNKSLKAFAAKKGVEYFGIKQFFETDFASSREAIKDEYYIRFDPKVFAD